MTTYIPNFPANNISLRDIQHASQLNNTIAFSDRLRNQLNDTTRTRQSLDLQEKLAQLLEKFPSASDAAQATLLQDIDRKLKALEQSSTAQDPQELKGRRTFGRGGPRQLTAAEIAEKELAKSDRDGASKRPTNLEFIDLTRPQPISATRSQSSPFIMPFSATGNTQSPNITQFLPLQGLNSADNSSLNSIVEPTQVERPIITTISTTIRQDTAEIVPITDTDIVVLETWTTEKDENPRKDPISYRKPPTSAPVSAIELPPQLSPSRPRRPHKRRSIYDGELVQPNKRHKRRN